MRAFVTAVVLTFALPVQAQDNPGFFDRLFGTDATTSDEEQGSYLEQLLEEQLSGAGRQVTVTGFEGALSGAATLDSLTIADANGVWLTLTDAELDWNRAALLRGRIEVAKLTAGEILLPRLPAATDDDEAPTPEATGFELPELPVSIQIDELSADRVAIGAPVIGADIDVSALGSLSLEAGDGTAKLDIARLDGRGEIAFDVGYSNTSKVLALDLSLNEDADGILANLLGLPDRPSIAFDISGTAPLEAYAAEVRLASDGADRLTGQISTFEVENTFGIEADISGDIAPLFAAEYRSFFGNSPELSFSAFRATGGATVLKELSLASEALVLNGEAILRPDGMPRRFSLQGEIRAKDGTPVLLPLPGPETRIQSARLDLGFDSAKGENWAGAFDIAGLEQGGVSASAANLQVLGKIVSGETDRITGEVTYRVQNLDLGEPALQSAVGDDLSGEATIDWESGRDLRIPRLTLAGEDYGFEGNLTVTSGNEGPVAAGKADVRANRLAIFSGLAGRPLGGAAELTTSFTATPLAGTFDITAKGTGRDLSLGDPRADAVLAGPSTLDFRAERTAEGMNLTLQTVETEQARVAGRATLTSGSSTLDLAGRLEDGALILSGLAGPVDLGIAGREDENRDWDVTARIEGEELALNADGRLIDLYAAPRAQGNLTADIGDISPFSEVIGRDVGGALQLQTSGGIAFDLSAFSIDGTAKGQNLTTGIVEADRLLRGASTLTITADGTDGKIEIEAFEFGSPAARLDATGVLQSGASQLNLDARLNDIAPFVAGLNGPVTLTGAIENAEDGNLALNLSGTGPGGSEARVTGTAAEDFSAFNTTITGTAPLQLANRFIAPTTLAGPMRFDLRLSGPPRLSSLSGQVTASGARLVAPEAGVALNNVSIDAGLGGGQVDLQVSGNVDGGGRVSLAGPIGLDAPNSADLRMSLDDVNVTDPRLFETTLDGAIRIDGALAGGARVSGDIFLGLTEIRIPSSGLGGAGAIPEITHINEPPPVRGTRRRAGLLGKSTGGSGSSGPSYPLDLRISAPNQLFLRGRGLDSEFGGTLRLGGTTRDVIPSGGFELIRGRLDILGRRLNLTEARITMQGSFVPRINLVAASTVEDTRIMVQVSGPADNPDIAFTSTPELPQEEVVSRLIFGRGIETLSAFQAARLALAIRTLAGQGGEGIVSKIRGSTGLADLDVTTTDNGDAAVRAGAYLNENVYTDVTIDSSGETKLNLNLDVTPSLTLRGGVTSEGESSLGIFFERDY